MAWMPPPTGIVMYHCDVSESIIQRESIHVRSHHDRHRPCKARVSTSRGLRQWNGYFPQETDTCSTSCLYESTIRVRCCDGGCATSHYWGREIGKLGLEARLIPAVYVTPFVKRQKTDANDAEAIAGAASRPTMRYVSVKSTEQQSQGMAFRTRDLFVRQRSQLVNALRGHSAKYGGVVA